MHVQHEGLPVLTAAMSLYGPEGSAEQQHLGCLAQLVREFHPAMHEQSDRAAGQAVQ